MNVTNLTQSNMNKRPNWRKFLHPRRRRHDPREARPEGSQFPGTGWIVQLVHSFGSRHISRFDRTGCRRRRVGDAMLVLNMSVFNFEPGWNRIFNPVPARENVWS